MYISELYRRTEVGPCYLLNYTYMGEQSHNLYKTKEVAEQEKTWLGGDITEVAFLSNKQQIKLIKLLIKVNASVIIGLTDTSGDGKQDSWYVQNSDNASVAFENALAKAVIHNWDRFTEAEIHELKGIMALGKLNAVGD